MNVDFILGARIGAHRGPFFISGTRKLGISDALVDGGNRHIDPYADAPNSNPRYAAVEFALRFRFHVNIICRLNRTAGNMGADTAVNIVQGHRNPDAAHTESAYTAYGIARQLVRGIHINVIGFQLAVGYQSRSLAG